MTLSPTGNDKSPLRSAHVAPDTLVLAGRRLRSDAGHLPAPRFADEVWDLRAAHHTPNASISELRLRFDVIEDPVWRLTAKEYAYARLTNTNLAEGRLPAVPTVKREISGLRYFFAHLTSHHPEMRLSDIDSDVILENFLTARTARISARWKPHERARYAWLLTLVHRAAGHLTHDQLTHLPFRGRTARQVAGTRGDVENRTPRIPPQVLSPYLRGALFYVQVAAQDILEAERELQRLTESVSTVPIAEAVRRLDTFCRDRAAAGRGLPARPDGAHNRSTLCVNVNLLTALLGIHRQSARTRTFRRALEHAVTELGLEPGGMDTPINADPDTGEPWRNRFDPKSVTNERRLLMTACYIVIGYLSGARDSEVQSLRRGCYLRGISEDGIVARHKIRGTVHKGRGNGGDEATWIVIEPVADAVRILERLVPDDRLFTRVSHRQHQHLVASDINLRLNEFRDHLNRIRSHDPISDVDYRPWRFTTRQFRRTVAWHIARQPFGVVAGKIQYKHVRVAMFEGYAGTSASGFRSEVDDERALAQMDSFLEQYEDFKAGVRTPARLVEQFDQIRTELDDFPGRVVDHARVRAMLANTARTYFPGVLNDCYFDSKTALCLSQPSTAATPVTNHCRPELCRNSCVTTAHAPAIRTVIADATELMAVQRLSAPQRDALKKGISTMTSLLAPIDGESPA
ncbi:hypothetical protein [Rhodococcus sp. IEGM 1307]|uniref:hypothetical protein n=1 Tax=Rhodococcus sp. IEGM 1307 TaxID=3047091 RepID=UPI0024B6604E|nr:hypothetical protein [Rhodococcus sp. IEGM 1307]MDI9979468.1 hypothetical protein [Rhodococcus sp. IEGM 1307]